MGLHIHYFQDDIGLLAPSSGLTLLCIHLKLLFTVVGAFIIAVELTKHKFINSVIGLSCNKALWLHINNSQIR